MALAFSGNLFASFVICPAYFTNFPLAPVCFGIFLVSSPLGILFLRVRAVIFLFNRISFEKYCLDTLFFPESFLVARDSDFHFNVNLLLGCICFFQAINDVEHAISGHIKQPRTLN